MKEKNYLSKIIAGMAAFAALCHSVPTAAECVDEQPSASAGFTAAQIESSPLKPVSYVTQLVLSASAAGTQQKIDVSVSGADGKWQYSNFHFYYDSRLQLSLDPFGDLYVEKGSASEHLSSKYQADPTAAEKNDDRNGWDGFLFMTFPGISPGRDGVIFSIYVTIPPDAKPGDIYPLDLEYKAGRSYRDRFMSGSQTEEDQLMEAYFFTRGIYGPDNENSFRAPDWDIASVSALADIDPHYDGYIAIADEKPYEPATGPAVTTETAASVTTAARPPAATTSATTTAKPATTTTTATTTKPATATTTATTTKPATATTTTTTAKPATTTTATTKTIPASTTANTTKPTATTTKTTARPTTTTKTTTATPTTTTSPVTTSPPPPSHTAKASGDMNSDSIIDSSDASEVLMVYAQVSTGENISEKEKAAGDVNADGLVDSSDASLILSYYAYVSTGGRDKPEEYFSRI